MPQSGATAADSAARDGTPPLAGTESAPDASAPASPPHSAEQGGLRRTIWRIGAPLLVVQGVVLVALSVVQYQRFELTFDFAAYYQAWWLIGHGHLDPFSTTIGVRFIANDFELLMWPLALLERLSPSALVLLVVEDLALLVTNAVTLSWALAVLERSGLPLRRRQAIAAFVLVSLLLNPWCYEAALWTFHMEPLVALLAVLAGRDLWQGSDRRLLLWALVLLVTGLVGALSVLGLGFTALLLGRGRWRVGWPLAIAGLGLVLVLGHFHLAGVAGGFTRSAFAYLLPPQQGPAGSLDVVLGLLRHPGAAIATLADAGPVVLLFLLPSGLLGAGSRWGIGMELAMFGPVALANSPVFRLGSWFAFQVWPALPFVLVGTVMFLASDRWPRAATGRALPLLTGTCILLASFTALAWLPAVLLTWLPATSPGTTALLARLERSVPARDELVVWAPVAGRFAARADLRAIILPTTAIPIDRSVVTFVFSRSELGTGVPLSAADAFTNRLITLDHATLVERRDGVAVLRWHPSPAVRSIDFPSAALNTSGPRELSLDALSS
ncbi:MAG: DUF2079 domain-containing protein [Actinomycetota bacterium]|jgi:hypothetical protein|nr:DUF2079 domain-containing protein [Actinomycetota bacterium]